MQPEDININYQIFFDAEKKRKQIIHMKKSGSVFQTPYYLIDERRIEKNLRRIARVREISGAKSVLALKCFSTWSVFGLMKRYMDGTTSSSVFEARLGHQKFGKEVHAYAVAFTPQEVDDVRSFASKIIFNSVSQLKRYAPSLSGVNLGLRVNPGVSYSHFDLADPARRYSRLGVVDRRALKGLAMIRGLMFHFNCENEDFLSFRRHLDLIGKKYGGLLSQLEWVSLGGGLYFTRDGYPLDEFAQALKGFSRRFGVQVYLEPGESAITDSAELVTTVLDLVKNKIPVAIVDASTEAHMLDLLIYRTSAKIRMKARGRHVCMVAGRSCLAGDVFGVYRFPSPVRVGQKIRFADAAGYTMVKKNWFNGLPMPSIVVRRLNGATEMVRRFTYGDFVNSLS